MVPIKYELDKQFLLSIELPKPLPCPFIFHMYQIGKNFVSQKPIAWQMCTVNNLPN